VKDACRAYKVNETDMISKKNSIDATSAVCHLKTPSRVQTAWRKLFSSSSSSSFSSSSSSFSSSSSSSSSLALLFALLYLLL
jgi:hypothetical protein